MKGVEPPSPKALAPKASVFASFTTSAKIVWLLYCNSVVYSRVNMCIVNTVVYYHCAHGAIQLLKQNNIKYCAAKRHFRCLYIREIRKEARMGFITHEIIEQKIFLIRHHKVMLDRHLAKLYKVSTGRLNEQVKRNIKRFPEDFMFQLTEKEFKNLKSQICDIKLGWNPQTTLCLYRAGCCHAL